MEGLKNIDFIIDNNSLNEIKENKLSIGEKEFFLQGGKIRAIAHNSVVIGVKGVEKDEETFLLYFKQKQNGDILLFEQKSGGFKLSDNFVIQDNNIIFIGQKNNQLDGGNGISHDVNISGESNKTDSADQNNTLDISEELVNSRKEILQEFGIKSFQDLASLANENGGDVVMSNLSDSQKEPYILANYIGRRLGRKIQQLYLDIKDKGNEGIELLNEAVGLIDSEIDSVDNFEVKKYLLQGIGKGRGTQEFLNNALNSIRKQKIEVNNMNN